MVLLRAYYTLLNILVLFTKAKHYTLFFLRFLFFKIPCYFLTQRKSGALDCIQNATKHLSKLPNHVSIVLVEDDICFPDIALMIIWCFALGISVVSVCDSKGILIEMKSTLKAELKKHKDCLLKDLNISIDEDVSIVGRFPCSDIATRYTIHLLTSNSGKQFIVEAAKLLSHSKADIDYYSVEDAVFKVSKLPDPQLVIKTGNTDSLISFCPWHARSTEIKSIPTHRGLTEKAFIDVFHRFSSTEQRWGK